MKSYNYWKLEYYYINDLSGAISQASHDYSKEKFSPNTIKYIDIKIRRSYENI